MTYTVLEPEVAGGLGKRTILDASVHPPVVSRLHYEFGGWLGDDLLESFPCFIVSNRLATELQRSKLTGFVLEDLEVSKAPEFEELLPHIDLPGFRWLRVTGRAGAADFGIHADHRLVVSDDALKVLERQQLSHAARYPLP